MSELRVREPDATGLRLTKSQKAWLDCLVARGSMAEHEIAHSRAARSFAVLERLGVIRLVDGGEHNFYEVVGRR